MSYKYVLLLAYPLGYVAAFLAAGYYAVYYLDWWDPKFGDPAGNLAFGREILPYFTGLAIASHVFGLAASWRRVRVAPPAHLGLVQALTGVLSYLIPFAHSVATRGISDRDRWADVHDAVAGGLLFVGPAIITWAAWHLGPRHEATSAHPAA